MTQPSAPQRLPLQIGGDVFASAIETYPDCVRVLNLDGYVEFMNPRGLALFEIDDFEPNRRYWPTLWPEGTRAVVEEALQAAISGETRSFQGFCPTAKGAPRWWDTVVFPVFAAGGTKALKILARSRDITKERETQALLDAIVQNIPTVLVAKEVRTGRFVLVNRAAEKVFGVSRDKLIGKTDHDLFPREQADEFKITDLDAFTLGGVRVTEDAFADSSGELHHFQTKKIGFSDEAGGGYVLAIVENITERKAAAAALNDALAKATTANRAKSDFLATMSHEIRTPLNGILGMVQVMQGDEATTTQRGRLEVIRRSGETLLSILNDILDLSRIEAGKLELEFAEFDMEHLVRDVAAAFAPLAEQKGLSFDFDVEAAACGAFNGDLTCFRRLLYNLASNAVKFTDEGGVRLAVSHRDGMLVIQMSDSGIGISPEQMPTLFEKFVQGDASHARRYGGSGLGLAICQGLAERMGGTIHVASTVGTGSTFTVRAPVARTSRTAGDDLPPSAARRASDQPQPEIKVLAAEDNEVNQLVLRTLLEQAGITPLVVGNGAEAVVAWEREHWDVILMDIQMPVMDGVSATRAIRAREAVNGRPRTPILAVTANAMTHQVPEYHAAGMDDVVPKPLDAAMLFAALDRALDQMA